MLTKGGLMPLGSLKYAADHGPVINGFKQRMIAQNRQGRRDLLISRIETGEIMELLGLTDKVRGFALAYRREIEEGRDAGLDNLASTFIDMIRGNRAQEAMQPSAAQVAVQPVSPSPATIEHKPSPEAPAAPSPAASTASPEVDNKQASDQTHQPKKSPLGGFMLGAKAITNEN